MRNIRYIDIPLTGSFHRNLNKNRSALICSFTDYLILFYSQPMAVEDLRRWTSTEAMGDITVLPDNTSKIPANNTTEDCAKDEVDHLLPSPEEQMMAVALR